MATRVAFEGSMEIGCFAKLTNSYCLVYSGGSQTFFSAFESEVKTTSSNSSAPRPSNMY